MKGGHRRYDAKSVKSEITPHDFYLKEQCLDRFKSKSRGWAEAGLCPFHEDNSSGSFWIHLEDGAYKCFSCNAKGMDIIAYTMVKYNLPFYEALIQMANEWGIC